MGLVDCLHKDFQHYLDQNPQTLEYHLVLLQTGLVVENFHTSLDLNIVAKLNLMGHYNQLPHLLNNHYDSHIFEKLSHLHHLLNHRKHPVLIDQHKNHY